MSEKKHSEGEWTLQGPKVQETNGQTYYTIGIHYSYDAIGFLYPYSEHSAETQQANMEYIIECVNTHEKLTEELASARKEIEAHKKLMLEAMAIIKSSLGIIQ